MWAIARGTRARELLDLAQRGSVRTKAQSFALGVGWRAAVGALPVAHVARAILIAHLPAAVATELVATLAFVAVEDDIVELATA